MSKAEIQDIKDEVDAESKVTDIEVEIEKAEAAYEALTDEQKQLVTNADVLAAARKSYDELEAVKAVEEKIAAIGEVTLASKGVFTQDADGLRQIADLINVVEVGRFHRVVL